MAQRQDGGHTARLPTRVFWVQNVCMCAVPVCIPFWVGLKHSQFSRSWGPSCDPNQCKEQAHRGHAISASAAVDLPRSSMSHSRKCDVFAGATESTMSTGSAPAACLPLPLLQLPGPLPLPPSPRCQCLPTATPGVIITAAAVAA